MTDRVVANYERFTIHALEAYFRSNKWQEVLKSFFLTNCPRFRNFNTIFSHELSSSIQEIDIQMHTVHQDFITIVEGAVSEQFKDMGIDEVRFLHLLEENLRSTDETVLRLHHELMKYRNFADFGMMMNQKFLEFYEMPSNVMTSVSKVCRVLWDIENIPVNAATGAFRTVIQLQMFLKQKGIIADGVDTRISAFLNPFNKSTPKKVIEELNKASVELICASAKREDADRKLGIRINQEMQFLNPACTTFVIVSSDQDFRQHYQLLNNAGYKVIVLHEAKNDNWKNALEMHATAGYEWSDVLSYNVARTEIPSPTVSLITGESAETSSQHIALQPASIQTWHTHAPSLGRDSALGAKAVGWRVAVCQRWASAFGFLLVDVSRPEVSSDFSLASPRFLTRADIRIDRKACRGRDRSKSGDNAEVSATAEGQLTGTGETDKDEAGVQIGAGNAGVSSTAPAIGGQQLVRVYVHNSALAYKEEVQAQRMLRAGEYVLVLVELDAKGPRAAVVKDIIARPHTLAPSDADY